jgi:primosomal protein N'
VDRRLLSLAARLGAADGAASSSALEGSRQLTEYRLTGERPERLTPQRAQALDRLEGRQGTIRELAAHAEVSDAVLRGLVNGGALERVQVEADQLLNCPDPDHAPPFLSEDQSDAASSLIASIGGGFDPVLLDGSLARARPKSISKRWQKRPARDCKCWFSCPRSR